MSEILHKSYKQIFAELNEAVQRMDYEEGIRFGYHISIAELWKGMPSQEILLALEKYGLSNSQISRVEIMLEEEQKQMRRSQ